ncbi:hypothetical protein BSR28_00960 [Boudabousia liubingyangii]|uniref:GtrA family protein n=1 Tax=Boudabousia liubingyangii TaxID=1921764 RepID=UPI00093BFBC3|nr:hypothetical protein BSR28_00960 [Boudabousia liubingyangii]
MKLSKRTFEQLVRFGLVGLANTAFYYLTYLLFLELIIVLGGELSDWLFAHIAAWCLAIVFSFFMNCRFTFKVKPTWKRFMLFPSTTLLNFFITTFGSYALIYYSIVNARLATLIASVIAIPFTFVLTKLVLSPKEPPKAQ